jgi:hypothetical protein
MSLTLLSGRNHKQQDMTKPYAYISFDNKDSRRHAVKQDRQCTHVVTLQRVCETIASVEKQ